MVVRVTTSESEGIKVWRVFAALGVVAAGAVIAIFAGNRQDREGPAVTMPTQAAQVQAPLAGPVEQPDVVTILPAEAKTVRRIYSIRLEQKNPFEVNDICDMAEMITVRNVPPITGLATKDGKMYVLHWRDGTGVHHYQFCLGRIQVRLTDIDENAARETCERLNAK